MSDTIIRVGVNGYGVIGFHGMPGSRLMMAALQKAALVTGARIIAPERPGYGYPIPIHAEPWRHIPPMSWRWQMGWASISSP